MQANQDPNWTDDAAFWEEAWADMSRRLDETPIQRAGLLPWWRRFGVLAGLLLLSVAVTLPIIYRHFSTVDGSAPKLEQPTVITTKTNPVVVHEEPAEAIEKMPVEAWGSQDNVPGSSVSGPPVAVTPEADKVVRQDNGLSPPPAARFGVADDTAPIKDTAEVKFTTGVITEALATNRTDEAERAMPVIPAATLQLPSKEILPLPVAAGRQLPTPSVNGRRWAPAYFVEAGATAAFHGLTLGNYLGIGIELPISRKLVVPVGIKLRQDFLKPRSFPTNSERAADALVPVTGVGQQAGQDTFLLDFSTGDLEKIATLGVEISLGVAYKISPRLRLNSGVAATYLSSATTMITSDLQAEYLSGNEQVRFDDLRLLNSAADLSNFSVGFPTSSISNQPNFNRWLLRAEVGLDYRLTNNLSLRATGRHLLRQPDDAEVIGVRRGQAEAGIRWFFR